MNPSSWSDTISLVLELSWVKLIELLEESNFQKMRVESSHSVDSVRAYNRQVCHPDLLWIPLLNQTHPPNLLIVTWILLLEFSDVNEVDQVNELHVSWEKVLDQVTRPFFEGFRQNCVVGV